MRSRIAIPRLSRFGLRWPQLEPATVDPGASGWRLDPRDFGSPRYLMIALPIGSTLHGPFGLADDEATTLQGDALCVVATRTLPAQVGLSGTGPRPRIWTTNNPQRLRRWIGAERRTAAAARAVHMMGRDPVWAFDGDQAVPARSYNGTEQTFYDETLGLAALDFASGSGPALVTDGPLISFVTPTYNTPPRYLDDLLASVRRQDGGPIELILSDDGSTSAETLAWFASHEGQSGLRIVRTAANRGIAAATNTGLAAARGTWLGLIDHDDALSPGAVHAVADAISRQPAAAFVYTDEVVADDRMRIVGHVHKPAFDPVLLSGVNYINHLSLYRRDRLAALGGLAEGFQGSQDYELLLRYLATLAPEEIVHLPYPAYVWRRSGQTFSATYLTTATAHARDALGRHYRAPIDPAGSGGDLHRVRLDVPRTAWPRVSVLIPNRDSFDLISRLFEDLCARTNYPDLEIVVVDNGTTDPRVLQLYEQLQRTRPGTKIAIEATPFNFSAAINKAARLATGEQLLLLNNDVEVITPDWLTEMVSCFGFSGVGIVGARLLYPDRSLQHAGVIVGLGGLAGHWYCGEPATVPGPMGRLWLRQHVSAVTGACLLVSRDCLQAVGPLDEDLFAIAYNDVDLCLRAAERGYQTIWTPFATLIHHESASRGSDETLANKPRFLREQDNLRERHRTADFEDPAYSPWYGRHHRCPALNMPARLPRARPGAQASARSTL